jgi:alkanesulfonate monooxygenase SsuD/methylene tetrahydromethanopterin reductase-like flavin-dependent oxidoreductase (luciferase family)
MVDLILTDGAQKALGFVFDAQKRNQDMIDGWELNWQKQRVERAKELIQSFDRIWKALEPLDRVGITLFDIEHELVRAEKITNEILEEAEMHLNVILKND